jgi:hypothetical protein
MKITKEVADFANWVEVKHRKNRNSKKKEITLLHGSSCTGPGKAVPDLHDYHDRYYRANRTAVNIDKCIGFSY